MTCRHCICPSDFLRRYGPGSAFALLLILAAVASLQAEPQVPAPPAVAVPDFLPGKPLPPQSPRKAEIPTSPLTGDNLDKVVEVELDQSLPRNSSGHAAGMHTANLVTRIKQSNKQKTDSFLQDLLDQRSDLRGLPVSMGDACRLKEQRRIEFGVAATLVRNTLRKAGESRKGASLDRAEEFWKSYQEVAPRKDDKSPRPGPGAHVAALMQVLGAETPAIQMGLVRHLQQVENSEATQALARLTLFASEEEVRQAALKALGQKPGREATEVLVSGLRYPWPVVAERAAKAVVQLERKDLAPQLVNLLGEPDPRLPVVEQVDQKKVPVVRELVRLNHNRNCLLCHAPGTTSEHLLGLGMTTAPIPSDPPSSQSDPYQGQPSFPDNIVRIDVTYLRQDFSLMQSVANAAPWPQMQRFDFFVRKRQMTPAEAAAYSEKLKAQAGQLSPYQKAAVLALRGLTGKDTEPTAEAWRRLLDLPSKQ